MKNTIADFGQTKIKREFCGMTCERFTVMSTGDVD